MTAAATNAGGDAGTYVGITLTPADCDVIAKAVRTDFAEQCQQILGAPLPDRTDVVRIRALLDVYARQIETLEWGNGPADIEMDCPIYQLDTVARDLPSSAIETRRDHRLAVCAMVGHFLRELDGARPA